MKYNHIKKYQKIISIFLTSILVWGCSDENEVQNTKDPFATFIQSELIVPYTAGEAVLLVEWANTSWEISMSEDEGIITEFSQTKGGDENDDRHYIQIKLAYSENPSNESREQELILKNLKTGEHTSLTLKQNTKFKKVSVTLDSSVRYQPIVGFGGMYNPAIWLSANDRITETELLKMYGTQGLGYNILRLMIYPDKSKWVADVQGAKLAQQHGAVIFACPWDCTDALADKVTINGEERKHLKKENYQAYTDHLIEYINYMKDNGVNLYAVSMQNEPDMHFTYWYPHEVVDYIKGYGQQIRSTGVKFMTPEACGMQPEFTDPVLNDTEAFAQTDILAGHLYQGFIDWDTSYAKNRHDYIVGLYNSKLAGVNKTWWMTEHLFNEGEKETDSALWKFNQWEYNLEKLGKEIHMCMEGYCSAYVYWYLKRFYGMMGDTDSRSAEEPGEILKNGYILSHYAKYASGMTRIKVDIANNDLSATAYINDEGTEMTVVIINMKKDSYNIQLTAPVAISNISAIETTRDKNMESIMARIQESRQNASVSVSPNSIISVRLILK